MTPGNKNRLGYRDSTETRQRKSTAHQGKKHSEATREKIAQSIKRWWDNHKDTIRAAHQGKKHSGATREKIAQSIKRWRDKSQRHLP